MARGASPAVISPLRCYTGDDVLRMPVVLGELGRKPAMAWLHLGRLAADPPPERATLTPGFLTFDDAVDTQRELARLLRE